MSHRFFVRRMIPAIGILLLILAGVPRADVAAGGPAARERLVILFTHDLHSYFLPQRVAAPGGPPAERGGYAKLMTLIREIRSREGDRTLLLDAGDFSMGTLFHTAFMDGGGGTAAHGGDGVRRDDLREPRFRFPSARPGENTPGRPRRGNPAPRHGRLQRRLQPGRQGGRRPPGGVSGVSRRTLRGHRTAGRSDRPVRHPRQGRPDRHPLRQTAHLCRSRRNG